MIFAYLIHLGQNFWKEQEDDNSVPLGRWSDTLVTEDASWEMITAHIAASGVNTLVIDLGEGIQYESHPELSCKGAWPKERVKKELDRIRKLGMEPIPKLNFSARHDAWLGKYSHMVSTQVYYKVVAELIDEVCELFDTPPYFHLGMDEEWPEMAGGGFICMRQGELFWHDIRYLCACCTKNGVRPWLWGDTATFKLEEAIANYPKEAIISAANYIRIRNTHLMNAHEKAYTDPYFAYADNGFEQVPTCATYYNTQNADDTMYLLKDKPGVIGFLTAPWFRTRKSDELKHLAEADIFGAAIEKYFGKERK